LSYEIAVIGDRETTTGMALAGATITYIHKTKEGTLSKLKEFLTMDKIGLILITHRVAEELGSEFRLMVRAKRLIPIVLRIPDRAGYIPPMDELQEAIKRTVGAEIVVRREV
jgi:vacuolar-type H+-ATPase subunit F/Vma7